MAKTYNADHRGFIVDGFEKLIPRFLLGSLEHGIGQVLHFEIEKRWDKMNLILKNEVSGVGVLRLFIQLWDSKVLTIPKFRRYYR